MAPPLKHFLDVARSLSGRAWVSRPFDPRQAQAIAQRHELPEILARVLAARGVDVDAAEAYLNPTVRTLMPQPAAIRDMEAGAVRIAEAVMAGETIGTIGDYDVDGVTSTALFKSFLRAVGSDAIAHIPDRLREGYGPSLAAVRALKDQGVKLLVTLDCGVMAHDPLVEAASLGMDVVIVDHHQTGETLPEALAVINPNRQDDDSGFGYLCAVGIAMILVAAVGRVLRSRNWYSQSAPEPNLLQWLELVALGTVSDVVPLVELNRAYVTQGLKVMARRQNLGLAALADMARLKRAPDPYALGFLLGPRLNAAGRIGDALRGVKLLLARDRGEANALAQELEGLNRERQQIELRVVEEACGQAEAALGRERALPVLVVAGEGWHPGVLGLAAARLKERYNRPSLALGYAPDATLATGSGRSIRGVDLGAAIRQAHDAGIILKGGGHAMAAGLTLERARLGDLRAFLEEKLAHAAALAEQRTLEIDGALTASGATLDLIELLEQAGPYGQGNPTPVFVLPAHRVLYADAAGADHVRLTLAAADGTRIKAIAFRQLRTDLGEVLLSERQHPLHVAGRLIADDWGANRVPSLQVEDVARVA